MKKHYSEGKIDWGTSSPKFEEGRRTSVNFKSLLSIYFLFISSISAQININGFCKWNEIHSKPGYSGIFSIEFNNDGYRDVVLFSDLERKITSYFGDPKSFLSKGRETYFGYPITGLVQLSTSNKSEKKYAFISRKSRTLGIASFTKQGFVVLKLKLKFDSYPSSIDAADINHNGKDELLVTGSTFNGIVIVEVKNNKLIESRIKSGDSFKEAKFIDLDYDGYPDIVAFNVVKNKIEFFYNNQAGNFNQYREIKLREDAAEFTVTDFNSDGFNDLVVRNNKGFNCILGDSVSSFQERLSIKTDFTPGGFNIFDYNGDGLNDIACYSKTDGGVYVIYAEDSNLFYKPLNYFVKPGICALASYIDRKGKHLAALSSNGNIYEISTLKYFKNDFSISITPDPRLIGIFSSNGFNDKNYYVIDSVNSKLLILSGFRSGVPIYYYSFSISGNYSNMEVGIPNEHEKTFCCYSKGGRKIESLTVDFEENKYSRRLFYTSYPIYDLKINPEDKSENQTIYVLVNDAGKLLLQTFQYKDFRYVGAGTDSIGINSFDAQIGFGKTPEIYWIERTSNGLLYNKTVQQQKNYKNEVLFYAASIEKRSGTLFSTNNQNSGKQPLMLYSLKDDNFLFYRKGMHPIKLNRFMNFSDKNYLQVRLNGKNKGYTLYQYIKSGRRLVKYDVQFETKETVPTKMIESQNISSYFVSGFRGSTYLVFSNSQTNLIEFKNIE